MSFNDGDDAVDAQLAKVRGYLNEWIQAVTKTIKSTFIAALFQGQRPGIFLVDI